MKIYSDDGKVFDSVDECKAYETELALKKQKEEAEKKARIKKLEEERKVKAEAKEKAYNNGFILGMASKGVIKVMVS